MSYRIVRTTSGVRRVVNDLGSPVGDLVDPTEPLRALHRREPITLGEAVIAGLRIAGPLLMAAVVGALVALCGADALR